MKRKTSKEILAEAFREVVCEWVLGKYDIAVDALAEVFEQSLPEPLKAYLVRE